MQSAFVYEWLCKIYESLKVLNIKENYFYILDIKEKGWVMDTQINYSRVNSYMYLSAWLKHHIYYFTPIDHPHDLLDCALIPYPFFMFFILWTVCSTHRWLCRDTVCNGVFFSDTYSWTLCVPCSLLDNNSWWHPSNVVGQEDHCRCRHIITSTHFPTIYWDGGIYIGSCLSTAFQISICRWAHRMWR